MLQLTSVPAPALRTTGTDVPPDRIRREAQLTSGLVATVIFLTAIAPLATDMYVPDDDDPPRPADRWTSRPRWARPYASQPTHKRVAFPLSQ
jgi:hypothetical protein